jgi:hypothetical protein
MKKQPDTSTWTAKQAEDLVRLMAAEQRSMEEFNNDDRFFLYAYGGITEEERLQVEEEIKKDATKRTLMDDLLERANQPSPDEEASLRKVKTNVLQQLNAEARWTFQVQFKRLVGRLYSGHFTIPPEVVKQRPALTYCGPSQASARWVTKIQQLAGGIYEDLITPLRLLPDLSPSSGSAAAPSPKDTPGKSIHFEFKHLGDGSLLVKVSTRLESLESAEVLFRVERDS